MADEVDTQALGIGRAREAEIFLGGARGKRPAVPIAWERLESRARKAMSRESFAYIAGAAGLESTMAANRAELERTRARCSGTSSPSST